MSGNPFLALSIFISPPKLVNFNIGGRKNQINQNNYLNLLKSGINSSNYEGELEFLKSLVDDSRKDFITTVDEELGSFAPYRDKIK